MTDIQLDPNLPDNAIEFRHPKGRVDRFVRDENGDLILLAPAEATDISKMQVLGGVHAPKLRMYALCDADRPPPVYRLEWLYEDFKDRGPGLWQAGRLFVLIEERK